VKGGVLSYAFVRPDLGLGVRNSQMPTDPVLVVHGGAWAIPDDMVAAHIQGVSNALAAGWRVLERAGSGECSALDAVEAAVVVMEDDETFDAGRGSFLNRDGKVQLDALIMDGATLRAGGVGCVEHLRNPVRAARKILSESPHVYFVGEGAEKFAVQHGLPLCKNEDLIIPREVERLREYQAKTPTSGKNAPEMGHPTGAELFAPADDEATSHDTVGAVALDHNGNIAAATSTGGTLNKAPGRLGDSSLIGCGCYADNLSAAASTTGWGEPIMKLVLAKWTADRIAAGNLPEWSAQEAMNYLKQRVNGHGGIIVLNPEGHVGIAHNTPRMAWAYKTVKKQEAGVIRET
jgi:L-asparaginase / beta-aspartyl-peptidase